MSDRPIRIADFSRQRSEPIRPHDGAPNVIVIVLDDVGFAQLAPYGSDITMPTISGLANEGIRYRNYHVTAMCSPTRAAMLTGQNHHAVGMGFLPEMPIAFPGYNARIPKTAIALPRLFRDAGYSTFAVGKWHLAPRWEVSASGPFTQWPLGLGFERYYGFLAGDTNQFAPELVIDNGVVDAPKTWREGYHLTEDLADRALRFIQDAQQATPNKPFLLWFATGAQHAPHQAPQEWIERFAGHFDAGWDEWRAHVIARQKTSGIIPQDAPISERPPWVTPWNELATPTQRLFARMMEVYAGFLAHTDAQIGRLLGGLEQFGMRENTMVIVCSDNGASAEGGPHGSFNEMRFTHDQHDDVNATLPFMDDLGGPRSYEHYPWGWAWAGNTPFKLWKRYTWLGGVRAPLIVRWPNGIHASQAGAVRTQFCHAVDLLPTLLDVAGIERPNEIDGVTQRSLDGASLRATLNDPDAKAPRNQQYFELLGSRAMYLNGWKATTNHIGAQLSIERELIVGSHRFEDDEWQLFDLQHDFAEVNDLAKVEPGRLAELQEAWWAEAERNQVLPLDDTFTGRAIAMERNPWPSGFSATYYPNGGPIAEDFLPPMGRGFTLTAHLNFVTTPTSGVVCALGDWNSGFALWMEQSRPHFHLSHFGEPIAIAGTTAVANGHHEVEVRFLRAVEGGGVVSLFVDADLIGSTFLSSDLPFRWQIGGTGLRIGRDAGIPVSDRYDPPNPFTGTIDRVELQSHVFGVPEGQTSHLERLVQRE